MVSVGKITASSSACVGKFSVFLRHWSRLGMRSATATRAPCPIVRISETQFRTLSRHHSCPLGVFDGIARALMAGMIYKIIEGKYSYTYKADGYNDAIAQWIKATFVAGCTANEPDNYGHFQVHFPAGQQTPAGTIRARISRVTR